MNKLSKLVSRGLSHRAYSLKSPNAISLGLSLPRMASYRPFSQQFNVYDSYMQRTKEEKQAMAKERRRSKK